MRERASVDEIARSLQGTWRAEHLFALKQALAAFDFVGTKLAECDAEIERQMQALKVHESEPAKGKKRGRARNAPNFDLRAQLFQMCGVGLTRIDGVDVTTALAVVSEVGADMVTSVDVGQGHPAGGCTGYAHAIPEVADIQDAARARALI